MQYQLLAQTSSLIIGHEIEVNISNNAGHEDLRCLSLCNTLLTPSLVHDGFVTKGYDSIEFLRR